MVDVDVVEEFEDVGVWFEAAPSLPEVFFRLWRVCRVLEHQSDQSLVLVSFVFGEVFLEN